MTKRPELHEIDRQTVAICQAYLAAHHHSPPLPAPTRAELALERLPSDLPPVSKTNYPSHRRHEKTS